MNVVSINGSSGFIGSALCKYLADKYTINRINRDDYLCDPKVLARKIEGSDVIINLAGYPISKLWTSTNREKIVDSRLVTSRNLVNSFNYLQKKPRLFISASGIDIYEGGIPHTESSTTFADDFLGNLCRSWEYEAKKAERFNISVSLIRTGIVFGSNGGYFNKVGSTIPFKFLVCFGSGKQRVSFIHLDDYCRGIDYIIEHNLSGVYNFVAPNSCSNHILVKTLKDISGSMAILKIPSYLLKILPHHQSDLFLKSNEIYSEKLLNAGFSFRFSTIKEVLQSFYIRH